MTIFIGPASYAQERIFLDEQVRFSSKIAVYNELSVLRVVEGTISIDRFERAVGLVLAKHKIFRTSLVFNHERSSLTQSIIEQHSTFALVIEQTFRNDQELQEIIYQRTTDANLFDLATGRVFHCEILRQQKSLYDPRFITESDVLLFVFHHAITDRMCNEIFHNDLCLAYNNDNIIATNEETLQYVDYAVHERSLDMNLSKGFWRTHMQGYNLQCSLPLPVDRHCSINDRRTGFASSAEMYLNDSLTRAFTTYASLHQVTLFQLGLATFYAFLYKLSHGYSDLCVTCIDANRFRSEFQDIMGIFLTILPYRVELNGQCSFDEFLKHVRETCLSILEHSHYPLQHILADCQRSQADLSLLQVAFDFITMSSSTNPHLSLGDTTLKMFSSDPFYICAKYDFMLIFYYNSTSNDDQLFCRFVCSRDLFDDTTVAKIARRFQHFLGQIFSSDPAVNNTIDLHLTPMTQFNVILPEEIKAVQNVRCCRQSNIVNQGRSN